MTIASMEELEALAPGSSVKVTNRRLGSKTFVRTEAGFELDGAVVEPQWFTGHVAAGQVTDFTTSDPETGDLYVNGARWYLIVAVEGETVWIMQFRRDGAYQSTVGRTLAACRELTWTRKRPEERPDWYQTVYPMAVRMWAIEAETQRVAAQWNEAQRELGTATQTLARMREARAAQIQVVATGVTRMPLEKAAGQVPDHVTVVDVLASWRREFTVTTEPATGCLCGTISREQVIGLLGIEGQSEHADFGFQVDCGRHS